MESDKERFYPSRFLKAEHMKGPVKVTVTEVKEEELEGQRGIDLRPILSFGEIGKELVLNKTNFEAMEEITGSGKIAEWAGTVIILESVRIKAFGEFKDVVRIRVPAKKKAEKTPINEAMEKAAKENEKHSAELANGEEGPEEPQEGT